MISRSKIIKKDYAILDKFSLNFLAIFDKSNINKKDAQNIKNKSMLRDYYKYVNLFKNLKNKKILDWGCGNGHISYLIKQLTNCEVISFSIEKDVDKIDFLKNELRLNYINGTDIYKLPFKDNYFDIVLSSGVLEHVNEYGGDISVSIKEIKRILKKNGKFFIWRLPFAFSIWEYCNHIINKWYHYERFTPNQIKFLAKYHSFKLNFIELDGIFFFKVRAILRSTLITSFLVDFFEKLCNLKFLNFLLNDIFCVLENK